MLCLAALCIATGCAGHSARTLEARKALDRHDPASALALYNKELEVGSGSELPKKVSGDNALLLLDRSTISQEVQQYQNSSRDLEIADKEVEMLDYARAPAHEIGRYLFSDDVGPYKARPYEKLLVNTINMVNYLAQGNAAGAKVEARRLAVMQKYLGEAEKADPSAQLLGPGSYLAGFVFERMGDFDEAVRYYDEALKATPYASLEEPVRRLSEYSSYSSPRIKAVLEKGKAGAFNKEEGDLLVVVNYGRVPALVSVRVTPAVALGVGALWLSFSAQQAARRLMGQGLVTWVNYPDLEKPPRVYASPSVLVDGAPAPIDTITHVDELVRASYEAAKGPIMASAITRMVSRAAVGAGVGVAAGKGSGNSAIGMLASMVTQASMAAADTPDTRSWATLPARIAISRLRLPAGKHMVRVVAQGVVREQTVEISKSGFAVVNLTELSQ
jgi:uncharacterized protein